MSKHRTRGNRCGVEGCTRPAPAGTMCGDHLDEVERALNDLPALAHALDARYLRQQVFSVVSLAERKPDESTLPFDDHAGRLRRELSRFLLHWVVAITPPGICPWPPVRNTVESESAYMARSLTHLRRSPDGPKLAGELLPLHSRILAAVDRPPDLVFLGVCSAPTGNGECPVDLYGEWGEPFAKCRVCRAEHSVHERRDVLLRAVADQLATATDISRGLSGLDMNVTPERIRQWKHRNRIIERGPNYHGDPLYRVGDVIDLVLTDKRTRREVPS